MPRSLNAFFQQAAARIPPPVVYLLVMLLTFGTQIPWLGFYLDDWIILNAYNLGGAERVFEYAFIGNRPLVSWIWIAGFKLLGSDPLLWQLWALFWRWMTVAAIWLVWRELWPNARRQVALAALLFAVYPLFRQQATALTFSFHWICYFLYGLSLYLMIRAVRRPRRFTMLMIGSLLAGGLQLYSQEFYTGIELLRPLVIWLALGAQGMGSKERLRRTLLTWLPFLVLMVGYLTWRFAFMPTPGSDRNVPTFLFTLASAPLEGLKTLLLFFLQDVSESLAAAWYSTIQPGLFASPTLASWLTWGVAAAVSFTTWLYFALSREDLPAQTDASVWHREAMLVGFLALVLGFAPGWTIGRHIYDQTGLYNDRFGLAGMFGAALLIVAGLDSLLKKPSYLLIVLSLMVGLGAGQNMRYETIYRRSWEKQLQLYWQLKWRAPVLEPPTTIIGDGALISYMGSWATISALVQMYAPEKDTHFMDTWYLDAQKLGSEFAVQETEMVEDTKNFMRYRASKDSSLVISFTPEMGSCLWVLGERDVVNRYVNEPLKFALPASNLSQIKQGPETPLREDIFGPEISRDWCYYYQKGDLARQVEDWPEVARLWNEARALGKHPRVGVEYAPFIEGFAHAQDWDTALDLTKKAYFPDYEMRDYLCETWKAIDGSVENTPEKEAAVRKAVDAFGCQEAFGLQR